MWKGGSNLIVGNKNTLNKTYFYLYGEKRIKDYRYGKNHVKFYH